jgi:hypothetical protein
MRTRPPYGPHFRLSRREQRCKVTRLRPGLEPSTQATGRPQKFGKQTRIGKRNKKDRRMGLLTAEEKRFLDVFLHEATTAPFTGPATMTLHHIGVEYGDISYIAWAYEPEVPRTGFAPGHAADTAPPLPWPNRPSALCRNEELQRIWEQRRRRGDEEMAQNESGRAGAFADIRTEPANPADRPLK